MTIHQIECFCALNKLEFKKACRHILRNAPAFFVEFFARKRIIHYRQVCPARQKGNKRKYGGTK